MYNFEIALALEELADLLEFQGEDFFKIRAYRQAARTLARHPVPVVEVYRQKKLAGLPGVGKNIAAKVSELIEKGYMNKLEELRRQVPPGVREMMALPGVGPKRARLFYDHLGVQTLDDLYRAAQEKKLRRLPGIGSKTEFAIRQHIERLKETPSIHLLNLARLLAREMIAYLGELPGVQRVEITGGTRRWEETVSDLDLLVQTTDWETLAEALRSHPRVVEILEKDENRLQVQTLWGLPLEVLRAAEDNFWPLLVYSTGNKAHLQKLQDFFARRGWHLCEEGVKPLAGVAAEAIAPLPQWQDEEQVYRELGLQYIVPELRQGGEELVLAAAGVLPRLIETGDIKGDLHVHSDWSDGGASIEQLAERARQKGYEYLAITDHSQSLKVARGLSIEQLQEQYRQIDRLNAGFSDFTLLKGMEVDIKMAGELDYPDEILEQADVVVASVHSGFQQEMPAMTRRIMQAIENPHVDIIGHLTGRMLGQRPGYQLDVEKVLELAGKCGKILEINSSPERLDLSPPHVRRALEHGAKIAVNTDAHDLQRLEEIEYGVAVARRAGLTREQVVNTLPLADLRHILRR
ncbi:DNA polymerase/3'-5' exonuclease PolX [Desulfurispora thermophila]|uniref:DNA polymerase/3'-5' exonuclease PolX n=1 Tax=Desulfurispora thermophila TaxID=265470 RepID=UPI00037BD905|nr:DNA polymerase/3'-5' exonuclease PolX [Desulfurispora thermophila]